MVAKLKVGTLNIRSLRHKLDDLTRLIASEDLDIIGITETWLDCTVSDGELLIPGFTLHRRDRMNRRGGGVCVYCRDTLPVKHRLDLETQDVEVTWIEVGTADKFLFGCLYRPPDENLDYWDRLDAALSKPALLSADKFLCGDLNVDVTLGVAITANHDALSELCEMHDLHISASGTTRVGFRTSPSTLDLLLLSFSEKLASSNVKVIDVPFSDHSSVTCDLEAQINHMPRAIRESRNLKKINVANFRHDIACQSFDKIKDFADVNEMWSCWLSLFTEVLEAHAPLRPRQPRPKGSVPWMDKTLLQLIASRKRLHRKYIRDNRSEEAYEQFKEARARAHAYNRKQKALYFQEQCVLNSTDSRKMWNVINTVTGRRRMKLDPICSAGSISQVFNEIVTDNTRPLSLIAPDSAQSSVIESPMLSQFKPVDEDKVMVLLAKICPSKATGSDGIPGMLLKVCADILAPSLTLIINKSLETGTIPTEMKLAHISPLHKAGDRQNPRNYRPVSLLPIASKILERIISEQLKQFLEESGAIPPMQFAYRCMHSTEDALTVATERLLVARDTGLVSAVALIDLSKAFDKVRHKEMIAALQKIGINGCALEWFVNYLSDRKQQVVIGQNKSEPFLVSCGVPQGSVLGPTLFSIYVRELPTVVTSPSIQVLQYADDIMLHASAATADAVKDHLTEAVSSLADWLRSLGLILNETKSQVLWVSSANQPIEQLQVKCNTVPLPNVTEAKYLGVTIDQELSWKAHVKLKAQSVAKQIGALRRASASLPVNARYMYYSSVIMSNLMYGSNAFVSSLSASSLDRIVKLQKRALRGIFKLPNWTHTAPLFIRFNEISINDKMLQKFAYLVWRTQYGSLGELVTQLYHRRLSSLDNRVTRGCSQISLVLPPAYRLLGLRRPAFHGAVLWNNLPLAARNSTTKQSFFQNLPKNMPLT